MTVQEEKMTFAVAAIREGTVIDHISAGKALLLLQLLKLATDQRQVTIGINLPSVSKGIKDLIKVEKYELNGEELHKIAVLAPNASINIIQNYHVVKKFQVEIPEQINGIFSCSNRSCITNREEIPTVFAVKKIRQGIQLQCRYCTKQFSHEEIRLDGNYL